MIHIDEPRLESDLGCRFEYTAGFMGFGPDDVAAIHGAATHLAPFVPGLVDAVYDKLHSYDSTGGTSSRDSPGTTAPYPSRSSNSPRTIRRSRSASNTCRATSSRS